jgi:hypothetical protein
LIGLACGIDVSTRVAALVAFALIVVLVLPQVPIGLFLRNPDTVAVHLIGIVVPTMANPHTPVPPAPVPATPVPVVVVPALGVCRFLDADEAEHSGCGTADGQPKRLSAGPNFTRERLRQLIEPSVVHASLFLLAA